MSLAIWLTLVPALPAAHTAASLLLSHEAVKPGETVWAGVHLRMEPGWHTYWQNSGDSGKPTTIHWQLPTNVTAGALAWPVPEKLVSSGLTTYVHHDEIILLTPLKIDEAALPGSVDLSANVRWFECSRDVCMTERAEVKGRLVVAADSKPSLNSAAIEEARKKLPTLKPEGFANARWETPPATNGQRWLVIEWPGQTLGVSGDFFPFASDAFLVAATTQSIAAEEGKLRIRKLVELLNGDWPTSVRGLLIEQRDGAVRAAFEAQVAVADSAPASPTAATVSETSATKAKKGIGVLLTNLGFAFLGGLILNLMPCVLPVIALKIFGFVEQARESPARVRLLGLVYGAGVVVSFLSLAVLVIAGKLVSWGAQYGDARFLIVMTVLVCLIALNLFGVFEVTLGGGTMDAAAEVAGRKGASGAFFNGVLATVLGTSCSAPFVAAAIGYAYPKPPHVVLLIFTFLGLGLAAPYVTLSFQPAWLRYLPKPGPWMERFKVAMGFPMLATGAWFLSLITRHHGTRGVLWVGVFLVVLALSAWIFGEFYQRGRTRRWLGMAFSVGFLLLGYGWILERQLNWRSRPA
ncbi:MAG TPA: protein-disulfide reductase DsbD domain-containing protein, partial [Verrucomicrobiae bacterium]|nr:protein-disulfide reductase DsbD domain-containing protein [Verrucomicrobiae bacterium]